jgi:hypothetical protein
MLLNNEALLKLVSESEGFRQINAVADARVTEVVEAVTSTHAGKPFTEVEAALRARFGAAGVPVPTDDFAKIVRTISSTRRA